MTDKRTWGQAWGLTPFLFFSLIVLLEFPVAAEQMAVEAKKTVEQAKAELAPASKNLILALNELAIAECDRGKLHQARPHWVLGMDLAERFLDEKDLLMAQVFMDMADCYDNTGLVGKARRWRAKAKELQSP